MSGGVSKLSDGSIRLAAVLVAALTLPALAQETRSVTVRLPSGQQVELAGVQVVRMALAAEHILKACSGQIEQSERGFFGRALSQAANLPSYDRSEVLAAASQNSANAAACQRYAARLKSEPVANVFLKPRGRQ